MITTPRMQLTPATAAHVRAEIADHSALAAMLSAAVPDNWPPEMLADALPWFLQVLEQDPDLVGWVGWYGVYRGDPTTPATLVGSGGFLGRPKDGAVEIGYSMLPQFYRQGFGRELVAGLIEWAFAQDGVATIYADIHHTNTPSLRLVTSLGFLHTGPGNEPDHERFALKRS